MDRYNFNELDGDDSPDSEEKKQEEEEDPRTNLRLMPCCGRCRYFFYSGPKSRRGWCKLSNLKSAKLYAHTNSQVEQMAKREGWLPVHTTNGCDKFQIRNRYSGIGSIEEWVGKYYDIEGNPIEKEEDDLDLD